jgi:hypothetical protein
LEFGIVSLDLSALKAKFSICCVRYSVLFAFAHLLHLNSACDCLHFYSSIVG